MPWDDIASCRTSPEHGHLGFAINWRLPKADAKQPPTERQLQAVKRFFIVEFPELSEDQCHKLLSCREFARLSVEAIFPKYGAVPKEAICRCLAAYLLSDDDLIKFCTIWSQRSFERGSASPRVKGAPIFPDVRAFADHIDSSMQIMNWTPKILASSEFIWPDQ